MSKTIIIESPQQFTSALSSTTIVVTDFFATWCGPCKQIAPVYEQLASQLSRPKQIAFLKVDTDKQRDIAQAYNISAMPTFLVFKNGKEIERIKGADPTKLSGVVKKLAAEAESSGSGFGESGGSAGWLGAELPKGYSDVTDQLDVKGLDLLNADGDFGGVKVLFDNNEPSSGASGDGKGKGKADTGSKKDWVESDTDPQLMLYMPFQATLKIHTLLLTSRTPPGNDADEAPARPKTIHLYTNSAHNLGFEEAEDMSPTQAIVLRPDDWNSETGTAKIELRFVKFQKVNSLVLFIVDGEGDGEKTRIDRLRLIGETGEKRGGKIEKMGEDS